MKTKWIIATLLIIIFSTIGFAQKLVYSTFLGSSGDDGANNWLKYFSLDSSGTIHFASSTYHSDFSVTDNAFDKTYNGGHDHWGTEDLVIVQFNIEHSALKYASYFGGKKGPEFVSDVLLKNNSLYLVGNTGSPDFPVTQNAFDKTFNGPEFRHADGYITRFDANKLSYSTYVGTSGMDWIQKIFVNENGEMIVIGMFTQWNELPVSHSFSKEIKDKNGEIEGNGNACVIRFNAKGDSILSMTVLGPTWNLDAVRDKEGNIYITGTTTSKLFPVTKQAYDTSYNGGNNYWQGDIFITKLTPTGDKILFSTFLGGTNGEGLPSISLDTANNIIIYGKTISSDFPVTINALDKSFTGKEELFLAKLSNDGKRLLYSSFLGGNEKAGESTGNIVVSKKGDVYVCGTTDAADFPVTPNAIQSAVKGGTDIFISVFDSSLTKLKFSTFFGGSADEEATIIADGAGDIIGVGTTKSADFPTTPGAFSTTLKGESDIVIFKIAMMGSSLK